MLKNVVTKTCACLLLVVLPAAFARAQAGASKRGAWKELAAYAGRDLSDADKRTRERIEALAARVVPGRKNPRWGGSRRFYVSHFWRVGRGRAAFEYVMLEGQPVVTIPGEDWHRVYLFDRAGRLVGRSEFSAGWRLVARGARVVDSAEVGAPLLELSTEGWHDIAREFYALTRGGAVLVRLEKSGGRAARNAYDYANHTIGPRPPRRTYARWARSLESVDAVEALGALAWLGGSHAPPGDYEWGGTINVGGKRVPTNVARGESAEDFRIASALRAAPAVRAALARLAKSENAWIREAAELVLTKSDEEDEG